MTTYARRAGAPDPAIITAPNNSYTFAGTATIDITDATDAAYLGTTHPWVSPSGGGATPVAPDIEAVLLVDDVLSRPNPTGPGYASIPVVKGADFQAAGDVLVGSGAGAYARLAKGASGQVVHVRSDGTLGYVEPPKVNAAAWGVKPSNTAAQNKTAIDAALSAAAAKQTVFGVGSCEVALPPGLIFTTGGHTDGGARLLIRGAGRQVTYMQVPPGESVGDILTLNGDSSGASDLTIDGSNTGVNAVVLNGSKTYFERFDIYNVGGGKNGLTVGLAGGAANGVVVRHGRINDASGYGIQIVNNGVAFDGIYADIGIGRAGKSGFRIDSGSQNIFGVHAWGCGIHSDMDGTDSAGFYLNSWNNMLVGCQSETNNSYGVLDNGVGNTWTGGSLWGNYLSGVSTAAGSQRFTISGAQIYRNNVKNTAGSGGSANAAVRNASAYFTMTGCSIWDDTAAVPAGSYASTPPFPFPGRASGAKTQGIAYAGTGDDWPTITGNTMRGEDTATGSWGFENATRGVFSANNLGATGITLPSVASAATITVPLEARNGMLNVTGTTGITSISSAPPGTRIVLKFAAALTVTDGGTLKLAGNFTSAADATLSLICDGSNWYETGRSTN